MGFSVPEIRSLIELSARPEGDCASIALIARRHICEIDDKIAALTAARTALERVSDACAGGRVAECRIIEAIALSPALEPTVATSA